MSNLQVSLVAGLFAVLSSLSPRCSNAAQWVTQPINLPTPHYAMDLAFHQANGTPYLLASLGTGSQVATRSAPWTWSILTSHCGEVPGQLRHADTAIDNLGAIHTINHDPVGNISVERTVGPACESEFLENTFQYGTRITTSPTNQLERVLVRRLSDEPDRVSLRLRQRQPSLQWSDQAVQQAAFDVSFDEPNAMTTDSNDDWWIATPVHYRASPGFQEVRLYHVGESIVLDPFLIQVGFVQDLAMRVAGGGTGPVMALQYAGIQPTSGQIAIFWRGALGWTFDHVDSNGSANLDVAMTALNHQYVAYMKVDPLRGPMVCVASRTAPEVGTRPFAVDTLIRAGHLGNGQPLKVALFVDTQDRPVVLTLVAAQDPGEEHRIYESVLLDPTTNAPAVETARRWGSVLTVSPSPVRLSGVLSMALSLPATRIYFTDLAGRVLYSRPPDEARQWEYPATSLFAVPGIYFVVAEGTEFGRIVRRVVVTN